jgi:hypothetical protein
VLFQRWALNRPRAEIGGLLKEYLAEANHNNWDCWDRRDLTAIRRLLEDMMRYADSEYVGDLASKLTTTNPVP